MKKTIHPAAQRGHADEGRPATAPPFGVGSYSDPLDMYFGALRVLNDDVLQGESGLAAHGHANMEIVSIPLRGALVHRDDQGNTSIIQPNDVQVMSAGTGIVHSEHNYSAHAPVHCLQIWILPVQQNLSPRYAKHTFDPKTWQNQWAPLVVSRQQQGKLWINQQAGIARASLEPGKVVNYALGAPDHGVYVFVIEGKVWVAGEVLGRRDGMGVEAVNQLALQGIEPCDVLLIEVPMQGA